MSTRTLVPTLTLAAALALAGCGGGPQPGAPSPESGAAASSTAGVPADSLLAPVVAADGKVMPPPPLPLRAASFPAYAERTLKSGAHLIVVRNDEQPVASVDLVLRAGTADDLPGLPGVADMVAELLDKGTATRSAKEVAEGIDFVGGRLSANASADYMSVGVTVLTDFLDTGLALLSDVVMRPTFPQDELETARARELSSLQLELSQPGAVARRRFLAELYGDHPYGALPTPASVKAITHDDLVAYHDAYFTPDDALFVVAGDVDPDDVARRIDESFAGWSGTAATPPRRAAPPERTRSELVFVNKPGSVQAVINVGQLVPSAAGSDRVSFDVMNQVLGGGYTSWLNNILRAQKGWTYGAGSGAAERLDEGYFSASTQTRNEVADSALATMLELLDRIRTQPVPAGDLEQA
ncbi:MAG TPA: pitrilysin family protein, partial [Longimicrobiales bacterium]|nr:pitrilysin family protein [Longimicrobiales bacterium]